MSEQPQPPENQEDTPKRDPRLEIPEILRQPVEHPSKTPKPPSVMATSVGEAGIAMAIAIDFLVVIAAGGAGGWLLDWWLGWSPYGIVTGFLLGFVVGLVRLLQRVAKDDAKPQGRAKK
ncbi:MAG: AtpZ/AtpI family protein [Phycisphaerales bacterium]|nr:AtpZ/AtpI family protein [Planctomycetota bacterium]MCH8509091.1 AtpZ/AtpI family protein [Phycisphaerales bacterium]